MPEVKIVLPYPPSVNHYYRRVGPKTLISREGRQYRQSVCSVLAASGIRPMEGPLKVHVEVHPPDLRRRDVDNLLKALLDALQHGGAYEDDSQVVDLSIIKKGVDRPDGRAIVKIEKVTVAPWAFP